MIEFFLFLGCHALMKEQKKHYIQFSLEFPEMKLLEKSTRTLWIGNLSEWITENQVKEAAKLVTKNT